MLITVLNLTAFALWYAYLVYQATHNRKPGILPMLLLLAVTFGLSLWGAG